MNAFEQGQFVEARGMEILRPFLEQKSDGQIIMLDKGVLARALQESNGDVIMRNERGDVIAVEIKCEESCKYGNFFLETWSNRNLARVDEHMARGSNPGWMLKLRADVLLYYFIEEDELYAINFFKLKRWAFGYKDETGDYPGNIYRYRERPQNKYSQMNDTCGRCVPIADIEKAIGFARFKPRAFLEF